MSHNPLNAQFQIPTQPAAEQAPALAFETPQVESVVTPEVAPVKYYDLKMIESSVFTAREQALATPQPSQRSSWLNAASLRRPQNVSLTSLIDQESILGGALVHKTGGDRFWLDTANPAFEQNGVADWFFMHPIPGTNESQVIRFQTTPNSIHKLYAGKEVPLGPEEESAFLQTVALYPAAVAPLYDAVNRAA